MANTKISNLPDLNVVDSTSVFPLSSNTTGTLTTYQASVGNIGVKVLTGNGYTLTNTNAGNITGTYSNITATGNIQYGGVLTSNVANGTAPMIVTSTTKVANLNVDLVDGRHVDDAATANTIVLRDLSGNIFANYYIGNGSRLTGITGANVTGTVANANYSVYSGTASVANSVAGANVTGQVNYAAVANSVAGANVTGTVANATYAVSAGSVTNALTINNSGSGAASGATYDGSATKTISYNTVGAPSTSGTGATGTWGISISGNANVANTANSVAVANVTGIGNIATINLDGNSGNILYGNGVFSAAPSVATANFANYAGNITVSSQPNITSVGTLTTLSVSGNANAGNIGTSGLITATGNITGGNLYTGGQVSATGNVTGGNIITTGNISGGNLSVTGNISGNFVAPGSNTQVIFNDSGLENATSGLTFNKSTNALSATGNITGANLITTGNVVGNVNGFAIGYRDIPPLDLSANTTISVTDAGKQYYSTSASNLTLTIANNSVQAFNVGAAINIINQGVGNITIAQGTGVSLYLAGNNISGNRTLSTYGMCTINKVATNIWFVVGVGLT